VYNDFLISFLCSLIYAASTLIVEKLLFVLLYLLINEVEGDFYKIELWLKAFVNYSNELVGLVLSKIKVELLKFLEYFGSIDLFKFSI